MPMCIYCRAPKGDDDFRKAEHVLPQAFGRFRDNLTLRGAVCDDCNKYFGDHLEIYLARDTPDGLNRFRRGVNPAEEYKSLGKRSTMEYRADSGELAGARTIQRHEDGELVQFPLPQIGFGETPEGPFRWFLIEQLPTKDELAKLFAEGRSYVHFCEVEDRDAVLAKLHALGAQTSGFTETRDAGYREHVRVEAKTTLGHTFGRAITKIGLNYLASQFGASTALMPQFDAARRYARFGEAPSTRIWDADTEKIIKNMPTAFGHVLTVAWQPAKQTVLAQISFHNWNRYQVRLAIGGFVLEPFKGRGHYFDLGTMTVVELRPEW